jgi:hypothetical protein
LDGAGGADPVVVGDFSDDRLAPTDIGAMQIGENILFAAQQGDSAPGARDRDFITFEVPEGTVMTQLVLDGYDTSEVPGQAFVALQQGTAITVDPVTGAPDDSENPQGPFAGLIYGSGLINNDLLPDLLAGSADVQNGVGFPGLDSDVLPAGTYTLWLNQGVPSAQVTLRAVIETAPVTKIALSIADAPTLLAAGDTGTTDLVFALTATENFTGELDVSYTQGGTPSSATVIFTDGSGNLTIPVANDDADTGDTNVDITLTGATDTASTDPVTVTLGGADATGTVTEDDASAITYLRGDVVAAFNAGGPEPGRHRLRRGDKRDQRRSVLQRSDLHRRRLQPARSAGR